MSKVIEVLAQMASDTSLQSNKAIEALLASSEINSELSSAIIEKDITSLERQLDIQKDIVCFMIPAEDDEPSENEDNDQSENEIKAFG